MACHADGEKVLVIEAWKRNKNGEIEHEIITGDKAKLIEAAFEEAFDE